MKILMEDLNIGKLNKWSPRELTHYLESKGIPIGNRFIEHNISGDLVHLLTDRDYERMGFERIGDVLRVKKSIAEIQKEKRSNMRDVVIWQADEYHMTNCVDMFCYTCTKCCRAKGDHYKLTSYGLELSKKDQSSCCGIPCRGCCATLCRCLNGYSFSVDNIYLSSIEDIDASSQTPNCCVKCFGVKGQDVVHVKVKGKGETYSLYVKEGEGPKIQSMIRDQKAESTLVELNQL